MKPRQQKRVARSTGAPRGSSARRRTEIEGQNPKADDSPDTDEHHDENRRNPFDAISGRPIKVPSHRPE